MKYTLILQNVTLGKFNAWKRDFQSVSVSKSQLVRFKFKILNFRRKKIDIGAPGDLGSNGLFQY